jgi:mannose-6-phosphate isomerase-like protein (cupin superfamily)
MKPVWRLSEILAAHKDQTDWTEPLVKDNYLEAAYISMGPGKKTARRFNADTREWWIVQDGQIRFSIEGQEPFVASKGYMVEVPYRNVYSMETVGDKPSLRFEVNIANATRDYPADEKPPAIPGMEFVKITVASKGKYENGNIPYLDFNDIISGKTKANNFVKDDREVVNIIRGKGVEDSNPPTKGHFHLSSSEFWFVMEGKVRYALETQPTFIADQGDVVYAPMGMWHLASLAGDGMSTRIAINGYVDLAHHYMAPE